MRKTQKQSGDLLSVSKPIQIVLFPQDSKASLTLYLSQGWLLIEQTVEVGKIALSHAPCLKDPEKPESACGVQR